MLFKKSIAINLNFNCSVAARVAPMYVQATEVGDGDGRRNNNTSTLIEHNSIERGGSGRQEEANGAAAAADGSDTKD